MAEKNKIDELRSTEVQEILTFIPSWIIRWGISVFFITLLMILFASWFIRYPEVVNARVVVTTENPPASIIARTSGGLHKFVTEGDTVKKGQYLGVIENAADMDDVLALKQQMDSFKTVISQPHLLARPFTFNEDVNLGELQAEYTNFVRAYSSYLFTSELDFHTKQMSSLSEQIQYYQKLNQELETQRKLQERELELAQKKYQVDQKLYAEKVIPQAELDRSEAVYLQQQRSYENARTAILSNSIQLAEMEKRMMELGLQRKDTDNSTLLVLQESYRRLQAQMSLWEQQYVLKSPSEGVVSFFKFWSDNHFVSQGEEVMTIVPASSEMFAMMQVPVYGSGKVEPGQRVKIRFDNFPSTEYGLVEATVQSISPVPRNNMYSVRAKLDKGLITSYRKQLEFRTEMQGTADILTENLRLLERIFNQFRSFFSDSVET